MDSTEKKSEYVPTIDRISPAISTYLSESLLPDLTANSGGLFNESTRFFKYNSEEIQSYTDYHKDYLVENPTTSYWTSIEKQVLHGSVPIEPNLAEEIIVNDQRGLWLNKDEEKNWKGPVPLNSYPINEDSHPEVVKKESIQKLEYIQEFAIRYLRPHTPPAPGDIIIKQLGDSVVPPAPPLIIRQQPLRPKTPEPLIVREAPPQPPSQLGRKIITIQGKRLPPPPRKVIIERLAQLPQKPQSVIVERWLPYPKVKRRVIFNHQNPVDPVVIKPKNIIVQWEPPEVKIRREFKYLGIVQANPAEYVKRFGSTLVQPENLPKFVLDIKPPEGVVLAAETRQNSLHELDGDVYALRLVDLIKEGLGDYIPYLDKIGVLEEGILVKTAKMISHQSRKVHDQDFDALQKVESEQMEEKFENKILPEKNKNLKEVQSEEPSQSDSDSIDTLIEFIFKTMDKNSHGRISVEDAEKLLLELNSRLDRQFFEADINSFFKDLNINIDGTIDLKEFKRAFLNLVTIS